MKLKTIKSAGVNAALCALFLLPLLSYILIFLRGGNTFLFEDGLLYSFPLRVFLWDSFRHGYSSQWLPWAAGGFSLLAEGQSALCFPATQIIYRLFPPQTGWFIEILAGQLAGFAGCYYLLRYLNVSRFCAMFGSSLYALGIQAMFSVIVPSMMWSYSLFPFFFLVLMRLINKQSGSWIEYVILAALLLLTGHPVMIVYIAVMCAAFVFLLCFRLPIRKGLVELGTMLLKLGGLSIVAVLIALPQLLPMIELYPISARSTAFDSSPAVLQNTLHMDTAWVPLSLFPVPFDSNHREFFSTTIRFPLYGVLLATVGFFIKKSREKWFFAILAVFLVFMALGPHIGLWKLVHSVPVLRNFRFPFRWLFFLPISLAVLSAVALDQIAARKASASHIVCWVLRLIPAAVICAAGIHYFRNEEVYLSAAHGAFANWITVAVWVTAAAMIPAFLLLTGRSVKQWHVVSGAALTMVALFCMRAWYLQDPGVVTDLKEIGFKWDLQAQPQKYRVSSTYKAYKALQSNRIDLYYSVMPNLSLLEGRLNTGLYCSFVPYWASDMSTWCLSALNGQSEWNNMVNICSAGQLALEDKSKLIQTASDKEMYQLMEVQNDNAMPRANVVNSFVFYADEKSLIDQMKKPDFDPKTTAALFAHDIAAVQDCSTDAQSRAEILVDRPDYIEIKVYPSSQKASFLVLSDTYYPGWKAFVNGVEKQILRTNYAFRGVQIPAGTEKVVFAYKPLVPEQALVLPTIVLTVLGIILFLIRIKKTPEQGRILI